MSKFKSLFPFATTSPVPEKLNEMMEGYYFHELTDAVNHSRGFGLITEGDYFISSDSRYLFKYVEHKRLANKHAVNRLFHERLQKATAEGHTITPEAEAAHREQAEREVMKNAAIRETVVLMIFDASVGRVWCSGGTVKQCEAALKLLRQVFGTLNTIPLSHDFAGKLLARQLCKGTRYAQGLPDALWIPPNGKVIAASEEQRVTFDGVDLRDDGVADVLSGMEVRAVEMHQCRLSANSERDTLATFVLHISQKGSIHLKAFDYLGGGAGSDGDDAHHWSAEMLIVSRAAWEIFDGLRIFAHGTGNGG